MVRKLIIFLGSSLATVTGAGLLARYVPPNVWWPPSIIALLLPGLLLLSLLFLVLCFYKKWFGAAILPGLILLAAFPLFPRLFSVSLGSRSSTEAKAISLISANVRRFKNDKGEAVGREKAFGFIRDGEPDVLLLQETLHSRYKNPFFKDISKAAGLKKRHQPKNKTIATYADRSDFVTDEFPAGSDINGFLITDVETDVGTIRVINVHLLSNQISGMAGEIGKDSDVKEEIDRAESMLRSYGAAAAGRAGQARLIRRYIEESPHPVIVGGDFNDVPSSYTYQKIMTPRLKDAWAEKGFGLGTTFTGPLPGLRIDFFLVDTTFTVTEIERIETGYSDHRGLKVKVKRKRE